MNIYKIDSRRFNLSPSDYKKIYVKYQTLYLENCDISTLFEISQRDKSSHICQFLFEGIEYDCKICLEISFVDILQITFEIFEIPSLLLYTHNNNSIIYWQKKILTYSDTVSIDEHSVIFISKRPIITALAKENLLKKKVDIIERGKFL